MADRATDRVSINRQEFEAFMVENQQLVERCEKLLVKVDSLSKVNKNLEAGLRTAEQKLKLAEEKISVELKQGDETLRKARSTMARLIQETDRRL